MKSLFLLFALLTFVFLSATAQKVTLKGKMQFDRPVRMIFLSFSGGEDRITDSTKLVAGKFEFEEKITEPVIASLIVRFEPVTGEERPRVDGLQLFLEP